jgi:chemotaxis signal transduction protein
MTDVRTDHYILCTVAGTNYAIPSSDVAHVEMVDQVTPIPNAAPFVDGVVFSRGQVVPAVNMRARFGFPRAASDLRTRLLVVSAGGRSVGLVVDSCREFLTIPAASIQPPGDALAASGAQYLGGIATLGTRLIVILKLDDLLQSTGPLMPGHSTTTGEVHGNAQAL